MKRMQALAPELKALKEKYKDDVQKLTQKQWELYRKHKVSPMSGCLPMVIQMPVFFGFFTMIRSAIELRGAHFLWVADLSKAGHGVHDSGDRFPVQSVAAADGRVDVVAIASAAAVTGHGSGAGKNDALYAADFPGFPLQLFVRHDTLQDDQHLLTVLQTKLTKMNQAPAAPGAASALTPPPKRKK